MICDPCIKAADNKQPEWHKNCVNFWREVYPDGAVERDEYTNQCMCQHKSTWELVKKDTDGDSS